MKGENRPAPRKTVIVTGASRGLGRQIALALARNGHSIIAIARKSPDLESLGLELQSFSNSSFARDCDLLDFNQTLKLFDSINSEIDVVIHNLGGTIKTRDNMVRLTELISALQLNLMSAVTLNELVIPRMAERRRGKLIHISSLASIENYGSNVYAISKSALNAYVRVMATELLGSGVTITGLIPSRLPKSNSQMSPDDQSYITNVDVLEALDFLIKMTSTSLSGTLLQLDGGRSNVIERFV